MNKVFDNMSVVLEKKYIYAFVYLLISFAFLFYFSDSTSPLYVIECYDSVVFKQMGAYILDGKAPYVDMFDHKGPLLYFIQALGLWINPNRWGIFLLQWLGLFISTIMWHKISRMYLSPLKSFLCVVLVLFTHFYLIEYGNLTEEYSNVFISISFYISLCIIKHEYIGKTKLLPHIVLGICLASVFYIRPNDAVAFIGGLLLGLFLYHVVNKLYMEVLSEVIGVFVGFVIVSLPIFSYYAYHDAIVDLWYGLIKYNTLYSEGLINMLSDCLSVTKGQYLPILIAVAILCYTHEDKKIGYLIYPTLVLGYILLGSRTYLHYFMVWLPIVFLSFWLFVLSTKNKAIIVLSILVYISLPIRSGNILKTPYHYYALVKQNIRISQQEEQQIIHTKEIFDVVSEEDKDSIWSYNLAWNDTMMTYHILYQHHILPCNRVQIPFMADVDEELYKEMNIVKAFPKYILFSVREEPLPSYRIHDSLFIENNYYVLDTIMNPDLILYKRK